MRHNNLHVILEYALIFPPRKGCLESLNLQQLNG